MALEGLSDKDLKRIVEIKNSTNEIQDAARNLNREFAQFGQLTVTISSEFSSINASANSFAKIQAEAAKSSKATSNAIKEQNKQLSTVKLLNIQIDDLYTRSLKTTGAESKILLKQAETLASARDNAKELATAYENLAESSATIDKNTVLFSGLSEVVKDIPGLRKLSGPFEAAAAAARETVINNAKNQAFLDEALQTGKGLTAEKIKELGLEKEAGGLTGSAAAARLRAAGATAKIESASLAGLKSGFKSLGPIIKGALGPLSIITTIVSAIKFFVTSMFEADKRITDISKNLSISKESAEGIYNNIIATKKSTDDLRYTTTELTKAFNELADLSDFTNIATRDQLVTQVELTKMLGLQVDEALQLQELFAVNNIEAEKGVDTVYNQIAAFANQNKIVADGRKILKEISKTSSLVKLNFKGSTSELTKTVLEAKKLGLSLDQVNKVADSLLNFEQSISSELEAELLLGRDINLEKAREFALTNDIAGLTQEIANQGITAEKFSRMNRIQQEAIAKTLGMSANELADSLYKQEIINKTAGTYTKQLREQAKQLRDQVKQTGNIKDLEKAIKLEKEAAAIEQGILDGKSLEEAQRRASAEEKFNIALERAKELFSDMAQPGGLLDKIIDTLGAIFGIEEQKSKKSLEEQGYTIDEGEGLFGTGAFKLTTLRDKEGKAIERALGSKGIQALEEKYGKAEEADDFIIRPGQKPLKFRKDDIVIGGTNLGGGGNGEVVSLLKELISAVTSGGDVYLDGTKVGTAMSVSTYKVQ